MILTVLFGCINIGRMDEDQILSTSDLDAGGEGGNSGGVNKVLAGLVIILLLILVGVGAYFFGTKQESQSPTPTPTQGLTTVQQLPTSTPSATSEAGLTTPNPTIKVTTTPSPTPTILTKTFTSTASLDGWRASNGGGNSTWYIQVGRNSTLTERGFVSFDISSISSDKTVTEATLRLYQIETVGTPYSSLGKLLVDHLNYGVSLDTSDYGLSAITSNYVTLTTNPTAEWKDAIVTEAVKNDLSEGRTRSQYRLHFETEITGPDAWARFESADNYMSTGNFPQLVIKYY
jgi:hypothetical protein